MSRHLKIATEVAKLVDEKNRAYGDSVSATAAILGYLYPGGIPVAAYQDAALIIRTLDKLKRIATSEGRADTMGEDPWKDVVGYALRAVEMSSGYGYEELEPKVLASSTSLGTKDGWEEVIHLTDADIVECEEPTTAPYDTPNCYYTCTCNYTAAPGRREDYYCEKCFSNVTTPVYLATLEDE